METQPPELPIGDQVVPKSVERSICAPLTLATAVLPSAVTATPRQERAMSRGVNGERPSQTDWPAFCAIDQPPLPMPLTRRMSPTAGCVGKVTVTVDVRNTGARAGDEVVQLYLHDPVASLPQPVRRLRGFERVTLAPGQSKKVSFTLGPQDFGYYDNAGTFVVEPGRIDLFAGNSSQATLASSVTLR